MKPKIFQKIQNEIIKLLVYPKNNLFMVADDDQSIYGFVQLALGRCLTSEIYTKTQNCFFMEENFRSSKNIVKICNDFIKTNIERYPKELKTRNKESEPIHIRQFKNEAEQLTSIANEIKKQDNLRDTAILYRNNISSIALADVFSREGIPFYLKEYKQVFFNHWVTQDIVAYLKFSLNNQDLESFNKIYYKLNAYISKSIIRYVSENNNNESILTTIRNMPSLPNYILQHINELESYFRTISRSEPEAAIKYIENCFGYKDYLKKNAKTMGYSLDNLLLIMSTLKLLAKESKSIIEFLIRLTELEEIMTSAKFNKNKNAVVLSTIHSSKGLEFEKVFMIDLINDQFPGTTSIDAYNEGNKSLLEEERRLFYVGMSRAKKQLSLYAPKYIDNEYKNCSLFVDEVRNLLGIKTQNKQMYKIGDIVQHIRFGRGKIIKSDEEYIDVYFYRYGNKKLSIDLCEKRHLLSVTLKEKQTKIRFLNKQ
jgi:DNA helicase-2/ATP-dependent DNA helicase PcrA